MKGMGFFLRLKCAMEGIFFALKNESSFRIQAAAALAALLSLFVLRPSLPWCALIVVMIGLVLAAELFNTAIEQVLDGLHPERAEFVRIAKDCSAAAVLVLSAASIAVFFMMVASS